MLTEVLRELDQWIDEENGRRRAEGFLLLPQVEIQVLGQTALLEAHDLKLNLVGTMDVDAYTKAEWAVTKKLDEFLKARGRHWDPHSHEIWMPKETEYEEFFSGNYVHASLAKPEYVLLSKALKAPEKNSTLITEYLALGPSPKFLAMAKRYKLDLEKFL